MTDNSLFIFNIVLTSLNTLLTMVLLGITLDLKDETDRVYKR